MTNAKKYKALLLANSNTWLEPFVEHLQKFANVWWGVFEEEIYLSLRGMGYENILFREDVNIYDINKTGNKYFYKNPGEAEQYFLDTLRPDVVITDVSNRLTKATKAKEIWVQAFHSFCYKRYIFHPSMLQYDLLLLPSQWYKDQFIERFSLQQSDSRLYVSGFCKLDNLIKLGNKREIIKKALQVKPSEKIVLYAPTWGGGDGVETWGNGIWPLWEEDKHLGYLEILTSELTRRNVRLAVKLHHVAAVEKRHAAREIVKKNGGIWVDDSPTKIADPFSLILASDLLTSDLSGIITGFLVLDKPIICLEPDSKIAWKDSSIPKALLPSEPVTDFAVLLSRMKKWAEGEIQLINKSEPKRILHEFLDHNSTLRACEEIFRRLEGKMK